MTTSPRHTVTLGQANGPDVELRVEGDESYASYETLAGHPAVYDDQAGLFCYARLVDGRFESTQTPVTEPPPPEAAPLHAEESPAVRQARTAETRERRARRGREEER